MRRATSFSQGAAWKRLISRYIGAIPPIDHGAWAAEQSRSAPLSWARPLSSAITAKLGVAARPSQPNVAASGPLRDIAPSVAIMVSPRRIFVMTVPPGPALITAPRGAIEPLIGAPQAVEAARVGRIGVVDRAILPD